MATPKRSGLPEFWSTTIAKVLSGEQSCLLAPWHRGHYKWPKRPKDPKMAEWQAKHSAFLQQQVIAYQADGWNVGVERFFKVEGKFASLSGKADLICQKRDARPLIIDCKTGEPRDSDIQQVLLYMVMLPISWGAPTMQFAGRVVYTEHPAVDLHPDEAEAMRPHIFALLKKLGTMPRPTPQPGKQVCAFCDIPAEDCPDRWHEASEAVEAKTELF